MTDREPERPLALVTGASSGIGRALARELAEHGHDVVIAAADDLLADAAEDLERRGGSVVARQVDLADPSGVEELHDAVSSTGRPLAAAALNAGAASSGRFDLTPLEDDLAVVDLNVRSVVHLSKPLLPPMVQQGSGRLLVTASIAGLGPGPYQATYSASKAFVHLFAEALRHELRGTGVTVTSLRPGPTETLFFDRSGMRDTRLGRMPKDDADQVARQAYQALMAGKDDVVAGSVLNRVQSLGAGLLPDRVKAYAQGFLSRPPSDRR